MGTAVTQALLEEWRNELARKPLVMSEREACAVLGVQQEEGGQTQEGLLSEDALKAAYRSVMITTSLYYDVTNHLLLLCLSVISSWFYLCCINWCALEHVRSEREKVICEIFISASFSNIAYHIFDSIKDIRCSQDSEVADMM